MRKTAWLLLFPALMVALFRAAPARGQAVAYAQIHGIITDQSGAVIPNAKITVTQTATGMTRSTASNASGAYVLPALPVGPYTFEVAAAGFENYVQSGIILQVGGNVALNVTMKVGAVSQQVAVQANATMVQTQNTSVSEVIDQRRMVDLPLNGRLATDLIILAGASLNSPVKGDFASSKNYSTSAVISVAGGQGNGNNYLMDGADNNDSFSNVNLPYPFPDALQEFSVETNGLSARYGLHPGSVVNVVTKSGTNQFHGDLFEFVRNGAFNARNWAASTQDTLRRNQFGGTVGGPIKRDKLFFFFGYQGTRTRTTPPNTISHVPTPQVLAGDFSTIESATCQSKGARAIKDPFTGKTFANGQVPTTLFNQQALNLLKYIPVSSDPCGEIEYGIPNPSDENQYLGRADWTISPKQTFFGRYFISEYDSPPFFNGTNLLTTTLAGINQRSQNFVLGHTYSINSTTVNTAHASWSRLRDNRGPAPNLFNEASLGIKIFQTAPIFSQFSISNYFNVGTGTGAPGHFNRNSIQLADDVDSIHGKHQITFGADWIHNQLNEWNVFQGNGPFSFDGSLSGDALLDLMLGLPKAGGFIQGDPEAQNWRQNYIGLYGQDDIHVNSRLNVHAGLRWEPYLPPPDKFGRGSHFDMADFLAGVHSSVYTTSPAGLLFYGDPGIPRAYTHHELAQFDPRVGVAWDISGNGKQTVRASYGIFYDTPENFYGDRFSDAPPWGSSITPTIGPTAGNLTDPYAAYPGGNPFPLPFPPPKNAVFTLEGTYVNFSLNQKPTYMQQWDLSFQRQFSHNWLVSATYIGNHTVHVWGGNEIDPAVALTPAQCAAVGISSKSCQSTSSTNQRRVLYLANPSQGVYYSTMAQNYDGAYANYNGLLLTARHRFNNNFTLLTNYTYSHCLSLTDFTGELTGPSFQDPADPGADYGNCGFDLRHNLNLSLVATTPQFHGGWAGRLLGGWQISPLLSYHSGFWFSPSSSKDNSLTGVNHDRPDVVSGVAFYTSGPCIKVVPCVNYFNPAAYVANPTGTFGNAGSDSIRGPGYFNINAALSRYFQIREGQRLEARFEMFNVGNNVNFDNPSGSITSSHFGQITGASDPRILQLALKYYF
ncbi:MAG: carboxypeptidase regulatory-like domain-containing protein [Terriglobia bacterium]